MFNSSDIEYYMHHNGIHVNIFVSYELHEDFDYISPSTGDRESFEEPFIHYKGLDAPISLGNLALAFYSGFFSFSGW